MLLKIYAWLYAAVIVIGILIFIPSIRAWNFADWVGNIEGVILAGGVLSFCYQKVLFRKEFWKCAFVIILILQVVDIIICTLRPSYLSFLENSGSASQSQVLLTILFSVPALIAVYRLGFP